MITCVLNAAEGRLDVLLGRGEEILCAQRWQAPTSGAELLTPALEAMLGSLRLKPADIKQWAAVRGPGSFTGVRLTLSTVAAVRRITGAHCAGMDYMLCLAVAGQRLADHPMEAQGHIWVLTHARRDLVHCQAFARSAQTLPPTPLFSVDLCSPAEAAQRMLAQAPPHSVMLGSGVARNTEALAPALATFRSLHASAPEAQDLWLVATVAKYAAEDPEPLYIRPCDAVDNLSHIAQKQGVEPQKAHARLQELLAAKPQAQQPPQ